MQKIDSKDTRINVRFSDEELAQIDQAADQMSTDRSKFVRYASLKCTTEILSGKRSLGLDGVDPADLDIDKIKAEAVTVIVDAMRNSELNKTKLDCARVLLSSLNKDKSQEVIDKTQDAKKFVKAIEDAKKQAERKFYESKRKKKG